MSGVNVLRDGGMMTIAINNPPVNAISAAVLDGLEAALDEARQDAGVRGVLIVGTEQIFAAGADIGSYLAGGLTPAEANRRGVEVYKALETLPKPTVAAVLGHCLGGGLELALAADLRVAGPDARFGQPEVHLGIIPGWNGTVRLPRLVGQSWASEIILTGSPIDGRRAYEMGLVNRLAAASEVWDAASNLLREAMAQSPAAVGKAKALVRESFQADAALREREALLDLLQGPEAAEGMTAFMERRRPRY